MYGSLLGTHNLLVSYVHLPDQKGQEFKRTMLSEGSRRKAEGYHSWPFRGITTLHREQEPGSGREVLFVRVFLYGPCTEIFPNCPDKVFWGCTPILAHRNPCGNPGRSTHCPTDCPGSQKVRERWEQALGARIEITGLRQAPNKEKPKIKQ